MDRPVRIQLPFDACWPNAAHGRFRTESRGYSNPVIITNHRNQGLTGKLFIPTWLLAAMSPVLIGLLHAAAHQAWYASINALFGHIKRFKLDYSMIPWTTFTDPEVARTDCRRRKQKYVVLPLRVTLFNVKDLDLTIAEEAAAQSAHDVG